MEDMNQIFWETQKNIVAEESYIIKINVRPYMDEGEIQNLVALTFFHWPEIQWVYWINGYVYLPGNLDHCVVPENLFSSESFFHTYKYIIRPCIEYFCYMLSGDLIIHFDILDTMQRKVCKGNTDLEFRCQTLFYRHVFSTNIFKSVVLMSSPLRASTELKRQTGN